MSANVRSVVDHSDQMAFDCRCELLMERAPLKVADVYRRAILSLKVCIIFLNSCSSKILAHLSTFDFQILL